MTVRWKPYPKYKDSGVEWLGKVPEGWEIRKAKRLFKEVIDKNHPNEPLLSATQQNGVVPRSESETRVWNPSDDVSAYKLILPGDFVISLRSFEGGLELSLCRGILSPAYTVIRYTKPIRTEYFKHFFKSQQYLVALNLVTTGIRQGKNISFSEFSKLETLMPSESEQRAIASFLDRGTRKIDALVEKNERMIELLKEKRQALITRCVTRGLPPDAARAAGLDPNPSFKDSGVEWLGQIPERWAIKRLKHVVSRVLSGGTPDSGDSDYWEEDSGGTPWVSISDMTKSFNISRTDKHLTAKGLSSKKLSVAPSGTLLYSMFASLGKTAILNIPAAFNQAILGLVPNEQAILQGYLKWWLDYMRDHIQLLSSSSTQDNLNASKVRNMPVFLPAVVEQRAIATFLNTETVKIDSLVGKITSAIEKLKEYRSALISAAVTGKIDVRGEAA